jgi:hypothetical protein
MHPRYRLRVGIEHRGVTFGHEIIAVDATSFGHVLSLFLANAMVSRITPRGLW